MNIDDMSFWQIVGFSAVCLFWAFLPITCAFVLWRAP